MPPLLRSGEFFFMIDQQRLRRPSKWVVVWMTLLAIIIFEAEAKACEKAGGDFYVSPATGRIHDCFGRERIFHGLNVVVKGAPWHPRVDAFDPQSSFTDTDVALLTEWGMNVVRLGIMWPGVEPSHGHVNFTYLEIMLSIVRKLHSVGIYTILEFHQDLYASQFCGEGMPSWILGDGDLMINPVALGIAHGGVVQQKPKSSSLFKRSPPEVVDQNDFSGRKRPRSRSDRHNREQHQAALLEKPPGGSGGPYARKISRRRHSTRSSMPRPTEHSNLESRIQYPASFPEPLGRRWPLPLEREKEEWEPEVERCNKHTWWSYYFSYAVSRAFQDLYDNKWGWTDLLARYWIVVAGAFKDQPGILGYELMNEPWPGDVFSNPLLFLPGVADAVNLAHFYEELQAAVRSVDRERILFFETITFDNFRCGWLSVPGGPQWQNKTVLSYHYYTPPNFSVKQVFAERSRESRRLGCGSMLTEFYVSTHSDQDTRSYKKESWNVSDWNAEVDDANQQNRPHGAVTSCGRAGGPAGGHGNESTGINPSCTRSITSHELGGTKGESETDKHMHAHGDHEYCGRLDEGGATTATSLRPPYAKQDSEVESDLDDYNINNGAFVDVEIASQDRTKGGKCQEDSVDRVLSVADDHMESWIAWEYKAFFNKTGSIVKQSLFDDGGEVKLDLAKKLARTYPQAVCGNINSFTFNPLSSTFTLSYVAGNDCRDGEEDIAFAEIFVHRRFYYPNGLAVNLNVECASFWESDMIIFVQHTIHCVGLVIDVRISKIDLPSR